VQFQESLDIEKALDEAVTARNVQLQSYSATGVGMLVAFLVIFCTLSMGVSERVRQLAVLRATVAHDFSLPKASHVWLSYGLGGAYPDKLSRAAQALYRDLLQHAVSIGPNPEGGPSIQVMPVEGIRQFTRGAAKRWIWIISQIPIVALLISSFGVLNVMLAAVRARRWEMGVLRSLGFTRSEVVRAVLAEGLLIGITASVLSLSFGILAGWCGCGFSQHISFFGGLYPALVIPWGAVAIGLLAVLVLAVLMAVWPAIDIARTRPLALLQRGRSSF